MSPAWLGAIPAPDWSGFELGPLTIHAYALCIILGVVAALWLGSVRWARRGGEPGRIVDVGLWAIPFGIVGARIYHVLTSPDLYFGPNYDGTGDPVRVLYIWEGGIGIWGAVIGGAVGAWIGTRRYGIRFSAFADVVAPGILLAQAIGRWGNYFNQELFGRPTDAAWGLEVDATHPNFPADQAPGTLFHPTFLYESVWNLAGVAVLLTLDRVLRLRRGAMLWCYVIWYAVGRIITESFRMDRIRTFEIAGLEVRLHALFTAVMLVIGLVGLVVSLLIGRRLTPEQRDEIHLPGHRDESVAAVAAADPAEGGSSAVEPPVTQGREAGSAPPSRD